jgi:hypothetical protein
LRCGNGMAIPASDGRPYPDGDHAAEDRLAWDLDLVPDVNAAFEEQCEAGGEVLDLVLETEADTNQSNGLWRISFKSGFIGDPWALCSVSASTTVVPGRRC